MKEQNKVLTYAIYKQVKELLEDYPEKTEVTPQRMYYWRNQAAKDTLSPTLAATIIKAYRVKPEGVILLPVEVAIDIVTFIENRPLEEVEDIIESKNVLKSLALNSLL